MFPISQTALAQISVQNQQLPAGGPKTVPVPLNFSAATGNAAYSLELQNIQSLHRFGNLQTLFVDNSLNTQRLSITIGGSGQIIRVKPGYQGYYAVLASNPMALSFSVPVTNGVDSAVVFLLNIPLAPYEWSSI